MSTLAAPVRVSPVIKFFRWSFLGVGVAYGAFNQSRLSRKETKVREIEAKQKAIRDVKLAAEKKAASEKELQELEKMFVN
ncbi:unnamed protein product [Ceutorhynchus assimilis]|uniref:ATP synthase F(0) complex subunit e, mitochondrial n=1 Tax=Ceutorhynchus assimilis TaxID=467358 RepID=A0A9N9MV07_9CUCU|nr:unnamed protein product [Ceutorhynchus assimilis]